MRTFIITIVLLTTFSIGAVESDPSNIVGFVRYECSTGKNLIALPLESNYTTPQDIYDDYPEISDIKAWDSTNQDWITASALETGKAYLVNCSSAIDFFCAGDLVDTSSQNLETTSNTNLNLVIIPLERDDLTTASQLADDIAVCNSVSKWVREQQSWVTATKINSTWQDDYNVEVADVLLINVTDDVVWPARNQETKSEIQSK